MPAQEDHYQTLGVARTATQDEIRSAYRQLAKKSHPDVNRGDPTAEERFKRVSNAYSIVGDESRRRDYDRQNHHSSPPPPHERRTRQPPPPSRPSRHVSLTLEEAFHGVEVSIPYGWRGVCATCNGSGVQRSPVAHRCLHCMGSGRSPQTGRMRACSACDGTGTRSSIMSCPSCGGQGSRMHRHSVQVRFPPGMTDGDIAAFQTPDGERVQVGISIKPSNRFHVSGLDLTAVRRISAKRAQAGTTVTIKGIDGTRLRVRVPPDSRNGKTIRVRSHGIRDRDGRRGDLLVRLAVSDRTAQK